MFECERSLLIAVTFDAAHIGTHSEPCLLGLETAVCVVAARACHRAFHDLVVERLAELRLGLRVAFHTKLRLALP